MFLCLSFSNCLLIDPTAEEEALSSGTITIVMESETGKICGVHHPGSDPLKPDELNDCISQAEKKAKAVAELINTAILSGEKN